VTILSPDKNDDEENKAINKAKSQWKSDPDILMKLSAEYPKKEKKR